MMQGRLPHRFRHELGVINASSLIVFFLFAVESLDL